MRDDNGYEHWMDEWNRRHNMDAFRIVALVVGLTILCLLLITLTSCGPAKPTGGGGAYPTFTLNG